MSDELHRDLRKLADGWCERRALVALHHFLPGYFGVNGLTDGFGALETALKDVLSFKERDHRRREERAEANFDSRAAGYLSAMKTEPNQPLQRNASTWFVPNLKSPARRG